MRQALLQQSIALFSTPSDSCDRTPPLRRCCDDTHAQKKAVDRLGSKMTDQQQAVNTTYIVIKAQFARKSNPRQTVGRTDETLIMNHGKNMHGSERKVVLKSFGHTNRIDDRSPTYIFFVLATRNNLSPTIEVLQY